ncbi:MAG: P-II family nitrogen regulator [Spirochaetes bacterium]|nr:MAG: P-II family nitrogen regulator [Spirochaetota bacterium]
MKYIIAIIRPHKLEDVLAELDKEEIYLKTVSEVLGCGRQKGITEVYRGVKEVGNLLRKVKIEVAVNEAYVERTVQAIKRGAREGEIGDGKIFILDLNDCIRIRTDERGGDAIG